VLGLLLRRLWLVLLLGALAGATAYVMTRGAVETYERTTVFVLRPSSQVRDIQIPDAVRGIASDDAQLVQTVTRAIETDRFLARAFNDAFGREPIDGYTLGASMVPGSDLIEVAIQGPDPAVLDGVAASFSDEATRWVRSVYRAYALDLLEIRAPDAPVSADPAQMIGFAALLGLLLGVGVVFAEAKARERATVAHAVDLAEPLLTEEEPVGPRVHRVDWTGSRAGSSGREFRGVPRPEDRPRTGPRQP
jgi:capsular polysaccharide biosynthesis protein